VVVKRLGTLAGQSLSHREALSLKHEPQEILQYVLVRWYLEGQVNPHWLKVWPMFAPELAQL
jgi:hypothetical protein